MPTGAAGLTRWSSTSCVLMAVISSGFQHPLVSMTAVIVLSVREWPALLMASTLMSVRIPPGALGTRLISTSLLRTMPLSERRQSQWLMQGRSLPDDQLSAERIKDQATRIGLVVEVEH